jgi:hypothetical protein
LMPDTKITGLATGAVLHSADWLVYVDTTDTTMATSGTDKRLSPSVLVAGLPAFAASGGGHAPGVVPDPGASAGTAKFLREDASWAVPPGSGGLAPIANNLVMANISGVSAVPAGGTLSSIIDSTISNVQGTILYRDSATWQALAPGTNGQALASQGAAANPHWITLGGGTGTVTSITAGSGLSSSPSPITAAGTLSIPNAGITYPMLQNEAGLTLLGNPTGSSATPAEVTLGPALAFFGTSLRSRVPIWTATGAGTVLTSSSALTNILTGAPGLGSLTIPANALQVGSRLCFDLFGAFTYSAGTPTLYIQIDLDGTIIGKGTSAAFGTVVSGNSWAIDNVGFSGFQVQAVGSGTAGKFLGGARVALNQGPVIPLNISGTAYQAPTQVNIDTTIAHTIAVKMQWSANAATYAIQLQGGGIYLDG